MKLADYEELKIRAYTGSYLRATVFQSWVVTPDGTPAQVVTFEPLD